MTWRPPTRRDSQRQQVYSWEWPAYRHDPMPNLSLPDVEALYKRMAEHYGISAPYVQFVPKLPQGQTVAGDYSAHAGHRVRLVSKNGGGAYFWTALHEFAHALDYQREHMYSEHTKWWYPGHGPTFVYWLMDVVETFGGADRKHMERLARKRGVKFAPKMRWAAVGSGPLPKQPKEDESELRDRLNNLDAAYWDAEGVRRAQIGNQIRATVRKIQWYVPDFSFKPSRW